MNLPPPPPPLPEPAAADTSWPRPTVCAWCRRVADGPRWRVAEVAAGRPVSHGICPDCLAEQLLAAAAPPDGVPRVAAPRPAP